MLRDYTIKKAFLNCLLLQDLAVLVFHTTFNSVSAGTQDPGLMEQRVMLSAYVEKAWSSALQTVESKKPLNIAVVLGDPRKKDKVKPACVFDDDDFHTLDMMKKALAEIPFMKFTFFDRHENPS